MASIIFDVDFAIEGIRREVEEKIQAALQNSQKTIQSSLLTIINAGFRASPEYASLSPGGELYGELGVLFVGDAVSQIVDSLVRSVTFTVNKNTLTIQLFKGDYSGLLAIPAASYISEKGFSVDWLNWLLLSGKSVILQNYTFVDATDPSEFKTSRTGQGLMFRLYAGRIAVKGGRTITATPFRIGRLSGDASNNWVTRVLTAAEPQIISLIEREVQRNFI